MSTREELRAFIAQEGGRYASVLEQHGHAVRFLCAKIDAQAARLEALEKIAHVPYDFTALVERLERLERGS